MHLLQSAVMQGAAIDTIERLAKLQREMIEYDAKVAFNDAMQRAQSKMKRIGADATNPQTKSKYASYAKLDGALRPIYSEEGFSLSFNTADSPLPEHVRVLCDVARGGHVKPYQIDMPADGKGAKGGDVMTKTHATGAAASYGMRYLLKMIFNVAVGEDDDDGNREGGMQQQMELSEFSHHMEMIEAAQSIEALQKAFTAAYLAAQKSKDQGAMKQIMGAKETRKKELR
jgi:ERF superfamily